MITVNFTTLISIKNGDLIKYIALQFLINQMPVTQMTCIENAGNTTDDVPRKTGKAVFINQ